MYKWSTKEQLSIFKTWNLKEVVFGILTTSYRSLSNYKTRWSATCNNHCPYLYNHSPNAAKSAQLAGRPHLHTQLCNAINSLDSSQTPPCSITTSSSPVISVNAATNSFFDISSVRVLLLTLASWLIRSRPFFIFLTMGIKFFPLRLCQRFKTTGGI